MKKHKLILVTLIQGVLHSQVFSQQSLDTTSYPPIPLPTFSAPKDSMLNKNELVIYNLSEHAFTSFEISNTNSSKSEVFSASNHTNSVKFREEQQNKSFSFLQAADQFSDFPNYPISAVVKLNLTYYHPSNGSYTYGSCSGAIINPYFIITAGHCVSNPQDQSYIVACTVIPAYNMGNQPFGQTETTNWYSFTQWTVNGNFDYDMAILSLSNPIGDFTGWLGWGYNTNNNFFTSSTNTFHSFGYPAQDDFGNTVLEGGERMYYMNGYMDYWESMNSMCHYNMGYHGQSGSGLYYRDPSNNDRIVYGVLSHGNGTNPPYYTCHCRMGADMFSAFGSIITDAGISEISNLNEMIPIYPNPSNGIYQIDLSKVETDETRLKVFDHLGKEIITFDVANNDQIVSIDLTDYASGIYLIQTIINNHLMSAKLIKNQ